jgi:PAS domain S-box-containing protein
MATLLRGRISALSSGGVRAVTGTPMGAGVAHLLASAGQALRLPPFSPYSLVTLALLVTIATIDIFLTPTLHVGVFLYPVCILTALWWGGERAVIYVTGLAFVLTLLEQWTHPGAAYRVETLEAWIGTTNRLSSLLLLILFGTACVWIARQQARFRHAQESLTDLEAKLTAVVQLTPDALVLANADGHIVFWNNSAVKLFGFSEEEALGRPLTLVMPKRYHEKHLEGFRRACETGESPLAGRSIEVNGLRKDNREFPLELSLATWQTKGSRFSQTGNDSKRGKPCNWPSARS